VTINGTGSWTLADRMEIDPAATLTLTAGTLSLSSYTFRGGNVDKGTGTLTTSTGKVVLDGSTSFSTATDQDMRQKRCTAISIIAALYGDLWRSLDPVLLEWLSAPLTPKLDTIAVTSASYLELVTSGSPVSRGCYQGSLEDCAGALGLTKPEIPALAWYSAEGRRELVARLSEVLRTGADREVFARCVIQHVDADCLALLQQNEKLVPPPLPGGSRASYLLTALKLGGSGALSRLLGSSDEPSMPRRLELVAGTSLDAVTARWRGAVLATRPHPTQLTASTAWAGMAWIAGLLLLSFRSSRWR
jgi:hypothetical protein